MFNEIALRQLQPLQIVTARVCLAAILLWLYICVTHTPVSLNAMQVKNLMIMAAINNVIPFLLIRILAQAGATNITLVAFLIPISAILLGVTFLDETLSINALAGMCLIFAGLVVIDGRMRQHIR